MLNRSRAMLERLVYVGWLGFTAASLSALILSLAFVATGLGRELLLVGASGTVISGIINRYGRKHLHFDQCERALEFRETGGLFPATLSHQNHSESLRRVFEAWTEVDEQILAGKMDVWERQALRRQARSLLDADPALRDEFRDELSEHPELK
jgi:hypothetical protein